MSTVIKIRTKDIIPDEMSVMLLQGIPFNKKIPENAKKLFAAANDVYRKCVQAAGIMKDIEKDEFQDVYKGQSLNAEYTPVPKITAKANGLALFAVTLGQVVHDRINQLFEAKELALGSMLDSMASAGAEKAADIVEAEFHESLRNKGMAGEEIVIMRYSPGYCGWHVSGQKKLFDYLEPEQIGMKLRESFLMEPLKSVSGVMIAGRVDIHFIHDDYSFCSECETHSCQERIKKLMGRT